MALTKLNFSGSGLSSLPTGSIIQFQSGTVLTAATTDTSGDFSNADRYWYNSKHNTNRCFK